MFSPRLVIIADQMLLTIFPINNQRGSSDVRAGISITPGSPTISGRPQIMPCLRLFSALLFGVFKYHGSRGQ